MKRWAPLIYFVSVCSCVMFLMIERGRRDLSTTSTRLFLGIGNGENGCGNPWIGLFLTRHQQLLGESFLIVVFRSNLFLSWLMMNWSFHFRSPIDASAGSSNWHRAIRCERMDARTAAQKISHRLDIYERGPGHIMHRCMWMHFASYPCMLHACNEQDMDFSNLVVANLCNLVIDVMLGNVLRSRSASTCRHTSRSMAKPIRPTRHEMHQRSQTGYGMHGQIFFDEFLY